MEARPAPDPFQLAEQARQALDGFDGTDLAAVDALVAVAERPADVLASLEALPEGERAGAWMRLTSLGAAGVAALMRRTMILEAEEADTRDVTLAGMRLQEAVARLAQFNAERLRSAS